MNLHEASAAFRGVMGGYAGFWCVAGGWAVDFFLGRQSRPHEDLEVVVLRSEHGLLFERVKAFRPRKIFSGEPPRFVPWEGGEIESEVIQLRLDPVGESEFDLLLTPSEDGLWICRRDEAIRLPLTSVSGTTALGLPYLAPEIVLLFKAKYVREKDQADFEAALPALSAEAREWLRNSLTKVHPGHEWLTRLHAAV